MYLLLVNLVILPFFILLTVIIQESNIKGGSIKSYCITRWTTSSESVNSVITLKPILEKVIIKFNNLYILKN